MTIALSAGERKKRGKGIYKAAFLAAMNDKRVLVIPLVALVAQLVTATIITGIAVVAMLAVNSEASQPVVTGVAGVSVALLAGMIHIYAQSLVLAAADQHFSGQVINFGAARATVRKRMKPVLAFGLLNGTVGALLRALRENFIGDMIAGFFSFLAGLAWAVATYFALPSILFDDHGSISGIKNSVAILKKRWAGAVRVNIIAGAFVFLAWLGIIAVLTGGIWLTITMFNQERDGAGSGMGLVTLFSTLGLVMVMILLLALLETTISGFAKIALYRYAKDQPIAGFEEVHLESAFVASKTSGFTNKFKSNGTV